MKITFGKDGLEKTWQDNFEEEIKCCWCGGSARIAFVAHEGLEEKVIYPRDFNQFVCDLHDNGGGGDFWLHDCACFAVYLCKDCLQATTLLNQG